jgi:hypothetical protein
MYEFRRLLKRKAMNWNEIMSHFGHPKPITNNKKPYLDEKWHALKDKHKLDKMLFSILDSELNDDFYFKKLKFNPSNEALLVGFKQVMEKWIQSGTPKDNAMKANLLNTHDKYDRVENMVGLLDVIDKKFCALFLMDDVTKTITAIYTTHNTKDVPTIRRALIGSPFF